MTRVITVSGSLEERTFDPLIEGVAGAEGQQVLVDARHLRWADPYGIVGLLAVGSVAARGGERPFLELPEDPEVLSYFARMGFFEEAEQIYEMPGPRRRKPETGASDVLLEVTPIRSYHDVQDMVERVNERGVRILTSQLNYPAAQAIRFTAILAEVCQNIVDHAEAPGWVATQTYTWQRRMAGRRVVVIAVMDLGIGFRASLASAHASRFVDHWTDATALEQAFMHGINRFHDVHRGQGLQQIRKNAVRWNGKVTIRSGSARIAEVPDWDDSPPLQSGLPLFPGSQIGIILPSRIEEEAVPPPARSREGARR